MQRVNQSLNSKPCVVDLEAQVREAAPDRVANGGPEALHSFASNKSEVSEIVEGGDRDEQKSVKEMNIPSAGSDLLLDQNKEKAKANESQINLEMNTSENIGYEDEVLPEYSIKAEPIPRYMVHSPQSPRISSHYWTRGHKEQQAESQEMEKEIEGLQSDLLQDEESEKHTDLGNEAHHPEGPINNAEDDTDQKSAETVQSVSLVPLDNKSATH